MRKFLLFLVCIGLTSFAFSQVPASAPPPPKPKDKFFVYNSSGELKWRGTVEEANKAFFSSFENGVDVVTDRGSKKSITGTVTIIDTNGNLKSKTELKDGKQHGEEIYYDEDGNIVEKNYWIEGKLSKTPPPRLKDAELHNTANDSAKKPSNPYYVPRSPLSLANMWSDFTYNSPQEKAFWDNLPDWTKVTNFFYLQDVKDIWYDSNGTEVDENSSDLYTGYSKRIKTSSSFVSFSWEAMITGTEGDLRIITYFKNGRFLKLACWDLGGTKLFSVSRDKGTDNIFVINNWYINGVRANHLVTDIEKPNLISFNSWLPNGEKCPETNFKKGSGAVLYYYDYGPKSEELNYKDGEIHGLNTRWYDNGQKRAETNYKDGKKHGLETEWYENGQKSRETNYKDGEIHGLETEWLNRQKSKETNYKEKKRHGLYTRWYPNGQKWVETNYKDGKKHGLYTRWDDNGQKSEEINFKEGEIHGLRTEWRVNGQKSKETNYKDGEIHGLRTEWYPNGQKSAEANYKDGKWKFEKAWKPNGEKCPETNLKYGTGVVVSYHENGQKSGETNYKDGKIHGLFTLWYENGQKWVETNYKDGKIHGLETRWRFNGQKSEETNYKEGRYFTNKWGRNGKFEKRYYHSNIKIKGIPPPHPTRTFNRFLFLD